jgi:biotin carboxyl carrier protein
MDITIEGTSHRVHISRHGSEWMVGVGAHSWLADVVAVGDRWSVLLRPEGTAGPGRSLTIALEQLPDDVIRAQLDAREVLISRPGAPPRVAAAGRGVSPGSLQTLKAPMPGRVVKVLVGRGDLVADRQPVVVLEAMKMQNDVRAPRGGRVSDVHVSEGALVEAGVLLVTVVAGDGGPS